jgi:hypothetical protein
VGGWVVPITLLKPSRYKPPTTTQRAGGGKMGNPCLTHAISQLKEHVDRKERQGFGIREAI